MRYKALLLDIDNTLYNYNRTHAIAKKSVIGFCKNKFNINENTILKAYEKARKKVHTELSETASSHNRLLYFQKMCELLEVNPLAYSMDIYNIYWDTFLENMQPFDSVYELLEIYKNNICLLTDLTAHIQYRKIKKLKLDEYCNAIVTSEEAGKEKPHPYMFMLALQKLDLHSSEVCMIGDSFKKDIFGARNLDIDAIWFNHEQKQENYDDEKIKEVSTMKELLELV
ncbi:MAG: HAD family hydrolase [Arcobacteraceae bacterium]